MTDPTCPARAAPITSDARGCGAVGTARPAATTTGRRVLLGAELEPQPVAVAEIGHEAVRVGDRHVTDDYLRETFRNVLPLSRTAPERIDEVRQLGDRALPASGRPAPVDPAGPTRARRIVLG